MDRKITIIIDQRKYNLTAHNETQEQVYRKAAAAINARLDNYSRSNPERSKLELMTLVALNEAVLHFDFQNELETVKGEAVSLTKDLQDYLSSKE